MARQRPDTHRNGELKYGFYGRLKAQFPSQMIVDVTEVCNLACIHCAHRLFRKSEHYSGCFLSPELNSKLVDEVQERGQGSTIHIRYSSNGEPLLNPHIRQMVKYAVRNSGVTVSLTTNGTLLNEKTTEQLLATGVNLIDISIDAFTPETYSKIRVNGKLGITRKNVLRLLQMARQTSIPTKVVVSYIEQQENIHETEDFKAFWEDNGADYVVIRRLHSNSGALIDIAKRMRKVNTQGIRKPCVYPWERIVLNARGFLSYCPADWTLRSTISGADYRFSTIYETWKGDFYRKLREAHLTNNFASHQFCAQCPDWSATRWPNEGRSYADMINEFQEFL